MDNQPKADSIDVTFAMHAEFVGDVNIRFTGCGRKYVALISEVFDPFYDIADWAQCIETGSLSANLELDEEGLLTEIFARPTTDPALCQIKITTEGTNDLLTLTHGLTTVRQESTSRRIRY